MTPHSEFSYGAGAGIHQPRIPHFAARRRTSPRAATGLVRVFDRLAATGGDWLQNEDSSAHGIQALPPELDEDRRCHRCRGSPGPRLIWIQHASPWEARCDRVPAWTDPPANLREFGLSWRGSRNWNHLSVCLSVRQSVSLSVCPSSKPLSLLKSSQSAITCICHCTDTCRVVVFINNVKGA